MEDRAAGQHQALGARKRQGCTLRRLHPVAGARELQRAVYLGDGKKFLSEEYLKALTPLGLAIWYMDDGAFTVRSKGLQQRTVGGSGRIETCVEAMSEGSRVRLRDYLRDTHGLDVRLRQSGAAGKAVLVFSTGATAKFQELVAPYMAPSMEYKLLPRFRGQGSSDPPHRKFVLVSRSPPRRQGEVRLHLTTDTLDVPR